MEVEVLMLILVKFRKVEKWSKIEPCGRIPSNSWFSGMFIKPFGQLALTPLFEIF